MGERERSRSQVSRQKSATAHPQRTKEMKQEKEEEKS